MFYEGILFGDTLLVDRKHSGAIVLVIFLLLFARRGTFIEIHVLNADSTGLYLPNDWVSALQ